MQWIVFCSIFLCLYSCVSKHSNEQIKGQQEHIALPLESQFMKFAKDTIYYNYSSFPYKMLVFISKGECISCKFRIDKWQNMINRVDSTFPSKVGFIFILEPVYRHEIYIMLKSFQFQTPVFVDSYGWFRKVNKIKDYDSHVWLLDSNNRVISNGDPTVDHDINDQYFNLLKKNVY